MHTLLIYLGLFVLAALEAFTPTAYLVPGTLGVAAAGGFVQSGKLNGPATLLVVWLGIIVGDLATFFVARKFGDVLRRSKTIAGALTRAEFRLRRHPVAFILLSHLSPFLKNASAPAAGVVGWSLRRFLPLEILASLLDATWFLALGYFVSRTVGTVTEIPVFARVTGAVALLAVVGFVIGRGRKCPLPRTAPSTLLKARRGVGFRIRCWLRILFWEFGGRLAKRAGFYDREDYRAALAQAVAVAEAGDVVLVGRLVDAPWGRFSHAMIVVRTPVGKALIHAYEKTVQLTPVKAAPMCGRIAVIHIACTLDQREAMVSAAWSQIATPFRLRNGKPDSATPLTLNCIGLIAWAAAQAKVMLDDIPVGAVIVPDDILSSANAHIIFEWQDGGEPDEPPPPAPAVMIPEPPLKPVAGIVALTPSQDAPADLGTAKMTRSELFLGMSRSDGRPVADSEMSAFIDEEVVTRFPAGATLVAASGTYGSRTSGIIHESSRLLTIVHPNDALNISRVRELAAIYCTRFQQEAVLISMSPALVLDVAA